MADQDPTQERDQVLLQLGDKISALLRHEEKLTELIETGDDPPHVKNRLDLQLAETKAELALCNVRYGQIDSDAPFSNPGTEAEDELLEAINEADDLIEMSAGAEALMGAFHKVVVAYPGASTNA